jgi:hypothetical protein
MDVTAQGFQNLTPFAGEALLLLDEEGAQVLTLIVKATYAITVRGLEIADEQAPIVKAPVYYGEPGSSSLKLETEASYTKVATDVVLLGHAQPQHATAPELDVSLSVGPIRKQVRVYGDRTWNRTLGVTTITAARPFERIPLVYERAFGGWDKSSADPREHSAEARNPVGIGYRRADMERDIQGTRLPNLEDPAELLQKPTERPPPAGFGYLCPDWAPRRQQAGTFDEAWRRTRFPRLPVNFNLRHFNAAPLDQQVRGFLSGGEPVEVRGAGTEGPLRFSLPRLSPEARFQLRREAEVELKMNLDTVIIDTDERRVSVLFRGTARVHRRLHDLCWSRVELPRRGQQGASHGERR